MKRLAIYLLTLSILLSFSMTVYAHDVPQERNDCSIETIVRYNGKNVDGGTLTAIKVGYVDADDGNFFFYQEFTGVKIEDITSSDASELQEDFYDNNKNNHDFYTQTQTVKNGKGTFSGLSTGLYLIVQEEAASGYHKIAPFLVSVPYMENDEYQYCVTATIKSEVERKTTEKPKPDSETEPESEPEKNPQSTDDSPLTVPHDYKLPQTGQLNWPIPLMIVSGLGLFILGWILYFRNKREQYEK